MGGSRHFPFSVLSPNNNLILLGIPLWDVGAGGHDDIFAQGCVIITGANKQRWPSSAAATHGHQAQGSCNKGVTVCTLACVGSFNSVCPFWFESHWMRFGPHFSSNLLPLFRIQAWTYLFFIALDFHRGKLVQVILCKCTAETDRWQTPLVTLGQYPENVNSGAVSTQRRAVPTDGTSEVWCKFLLIYICHQKAPNPVCSTRSAHMVAYIRATTPSFRVNVSDLAASLSFSCVFQFLFWEPKQQTAFLGSRCSMLYWYVPKLKKTWSVALG